MTTESRRKSPARTTGTPLRTIRDHAAAPATPAPLDAVDLRLLLLVALAPKPTPRPSPHLDWPRSRRLD